MALRLLPGLGLLLALYISLAFQNDPPQEKPPSFGVLEETELRENSLGFRLYKVVEGNEDNKRAAVLFVHGHLGHADQGVPLASHLFLTGSDIDVYTVDFRVSPVAFSHSLLLSQAEYVQTCLDFLQLSYPNSSLAIIGHSMGGVVSALSLVSYPSLPGIGLFVALASPLEQHPLNADLAEPAVYEKIHSFWKRGKGVPTVSIAGGVRDMMIPAQLTAISELLSKNAHHFYSSQLLGVSSPPDHLSIAWTPALLEVLRICLHHYLLSSSPDPLPLASVLSPVSLAFRPPTDCVLSQVEAASQAKPAVGGSITAPGEVLANLGTTTLLFAVYSDQPVSLLRLRQSGFAHICGLPRADHLSILALAPEEQLLTPSPACLVPVETVQITESLLYLSLCSVKFVCETGACRLMPTPAFAVSRYPMRILASTEVLIYARCGSEEVVHSGSRDAVLWLHEQCAEGPTVWVIGAEGQCGWREKVEIEVFVDGWGSVFLHFLDFRLTLVSFSLSSFLLPLRTLPVLLIHLSLVLPLCISSSALRSLGLLHLDHVHYTAGYSLGLLDLAFLLSVSQIAAVLLEATVHAAVWAGNCWAKYSVPGRTAKKLICVSAGVSLVCPMAAVGALMAVIAGNVRLQSQKTMAGIALAQLMMLTPQIFAWGWGIAVSGRWELADVHLSLSLICLHIGLYALLSLRSDDSLIRYTVPAGIYLSLFSFDLLYRANLCLAVCQVMIGLGTTARPKLIRN